MAVNEHPESEWELEEEEPDEAVFESSYEGTGSPDSIWIREQGPIYDLPLDDIAREIPFKDDISKTGIRYMPTGLRTAWRALKRRYSCSLQTIEYHCSRHGCMIALRDSRIKELTKTYDQKVHEALHKADGYDGTFLKRLEERNEAVDYVMPLKFNTSVVMSKGMVGILSNMADAIGTSNIKVYCWLCIISILTLRKPLKGRKILEQEEDHFWEIVEERLATLKQKKRKTLERKNTKR